MKMENELTQIASRPNQDSEHENKNQFYIDLFWIVVLIFGAYFASGFVVVKYFL